MAHGKRGKSDPDAKPYMVFASDGYRWGPGFPDENRAGQKPYLADRAPSWTAAAVSSAGVG